MSFFAQTSKTRGKIVEIKIPALSPACSGAIPKELPRLVYVLIISATTPAMYGPKAHPKSPKNAIKLKTVVPPLGKLPDAKEKHPGQRMLEARPERAQPTSAIAGDGESEVMR